MTDDEKKIEANITYKAHKTLTGIFNQQTIYDICGVQPMTGPTDLIFALKSKYGTNSDD